MRLSTRGRYGVRLMLDLALHNGKGPVLLKDIARRQEVSEKYLWQLIEPLKVAGLINSTRGAHGGYTLARLPSEITLKNIVYVLEGQLCLVDCVSNPKLCRRSQTCVSRDVWKELSSNILLTLDSITLEDMVERQKNKAITFDI